MTTRTVRATLVDGLERLGLARHAYSLYEILRASGVPEGRAASDGLAVPPRRLRMTIAGTPDATWFLESGRLTARVISDALAEYGQTTDQLNLLDFGCGCGRVTRHWHRSRDVVLHGTDVNRRLVSWCSSNLQFATFSHNDLAPPLQFEDASFDAAYAISVFTHLPAELGLAWLGEFSRVLRPGGLLICSIHGDRYLERLTASERALYLSGTPVVRSTSVAGTNLCTAFHPAAYIRTRFTEHLEILSHVPEGAAGTPHQDLVVLRRRA